MVNDDGSVTLSWEAPDDDSITSACIVPTFNFSGCHIWRSERSPA